MWMSYQSVCPIVCAAYQHLDCQMECGEILKHLLTSLSFEWNQRGIMDTLHQVCIYRIPSYIRKHFVYRGSSLLIVQWENRLCTGFQKEMHSFIVMYSKMSFLLNTRVIKCSTVKFFMGLTYLMRIFKLF
jgi:hypothetical protein